MIKTAISLPFIFYQLLIPYWGHIKESEKIIWGCAGGRGGRAGCTISLVSSPIIYSSTLEYIMLHSLQGFSPL